MLDLVGIVFSGVMMMFVIIRAVHLDSARPWFEPPPEPDQPPEPEATPRPGRWQARPVRSRGAPR